MKITIYCKVPTAYQLSSISTLMGFWQELPNGSLWAEKTFGTKKQAREWMDNRNRYLYSDGAISESQYKDNKKSIKSKWPLMEYDGAVCSIKN